MIAALLLPLLPACSPAPEKASYDCPDAWGWDGSDCYPLLPETDGVDPVGSPEPLAEGELDLETQRALAERFQPAQVFSGERFWPVSVDYCAASGADLYQHPLADEDYDEGVLVATNAELAALDYATLPVDDVVYQLDCPGDNSGPGYDEASWFDAWDELQGDDPATATWTPVHYVHLAWLDRAASLLLIQYWFWYPFDKFANNHEGDWEHTNAVVDLSGAEPALVDVHFFFHSGSTRAFQRITRITDEAGGDHPVVFVGGCGEFNGWGGCYSGASYPWPAVYQGTATLILEDVTPMARALHPDDIAVVLWPEPEAVEPGGELALSWLPLRLFHGQWHVEQNDPIIVYSGGDGPPTPPAWKGDWNTGVDEDTWSERDEIESEYVFFHPPEGWEVLYNPGHDDLVDRD